MSKPTEEKARELAELQRNPLVLAKYIIQQYDNQQRSQQEQSEEAFNEIEGNANNQVQESRWISLLRSDKYGQLIETPKFRKFATDYIANQWRDLAIKGGYNHNSGMAMPCDRLTRGTICVPHLPEGDVILTRYPIVNSDNIRLYSNIHDPELKKTRNVVWIHPKDAEEYHQADFDGDQLMVSPASKLPNIAQETLWEPTRIRSRDRHEFRYLFSKETLSVDALEWAEELKTRFQEARDEIKERVGDDREAFNEELGKLYESYRAEIDELFSTSEERFVSRADKLRQCVASRREGAAALWHTQHTRPELDRHRKDCLKLAEQMEITFSFEHDYELPSVALPQDIYVLSVPFGAGAIKWKESLEQKGIKFDATIHPQLPLIEFALKDLSPKIVDKLVAKFGENINDLDELNIPKDLRIIPPADHSWATSRQDSGVGALAYNLFTEEVCQQLQDFQFDEIKVLGIKYNHFANENFSSKQWKKRSVTLEVGVFELPESHPEFYRYNGTPILQIDGKNLGTFAPDSPKLPIGATFAATLQPDGSSGEQCGFVRSGEQGAIAKIFSP